MPFQITYGHFLLYTTKYLTHNDPRQWSRWPTNLLLGIYIASVFQNIVIFWHLVTSIFHSAILPSINLFVIFSKLSILIRNLRFTTFGKTSWNIHSYYRILIAFHVKEDRSKYIVCPKRGTVCPLFLPLIVSSKIRYVYSPLLKKRCKKDLLYHKKILFTPSVYKINYNTQIYRQNTTDKFYINENLTY